MKLSKNSFFKLKIAILAFVLIICSVWGAFSLLPHFSANAATEYSEYEDVTSTLTSNSSFDSRSDTSSTPSQPNNFSHENVAKEDDKYIHGVINLTDSDINYSNSEPQKHEYVLMLNGSEKYGSRFEYTTNNTMKLNADSYYEISVDVYSNNNVGKLIIYDADNVSIKTIDNISTNSGWSTYRFFISTNEFDEMSIKLGLAIDGNGVVLYDNVHAYKISPKYLQTLKTELESQYYSEINKRDNSAEKIALTGFINIASSSENNGKNTKISYPDNNLDGNAYDGEHTSALKIENITQTYSTYKKENFATFKQNNIYKITVTAKSTLTATTNLKLIQTKLEENEDGETEQGTDSGVISISTSTNENLYNGYQKYCFYVKASSLKDTYYDLLINLGSADNSAEGSLYITSINIAKINYSNYSNASSTNNVKLDLSNTETSDTNKYFSNGEFNNLQIEDAKKPLPATPNSWTVDADKNSKYGIINTESNSFASLKLPAFVPNPKPAENDNVLMMYNSTPTSISYTSTSKEITPNLETGYSAIYLDVMPVLADVTINLYHSGDSNIRLGSLTIAAEEAPIWKTAKFIIYNPYQTLNAVLEIKMTSKNAAVCFVDNVTFNYDHAKNSNVSISSETFAALQDGKTTKKIDLSNLFASNGIDDFASSLFFVGDGDLQGGSAGIIDTSISSLVDVLPSQMVENDYQIDNLKKARQFTNPNIIGIKVENDTFYNLTSNLGFKLDASNYYKFSIDVFTPVLSSSSEEETGARISLSSFQENFVNIKSADDWQTYTFYINPDNSTTAYITLGLGNENAKCQGRIFFGNIKFEQFATEEDFNAQAIAGKTALVLKQVKEEETPDDENTQTDSTTSNSNKSNWFYYLPSIIFAVVIVICVVGIMLRKVKWKKPVKKSKTTYDRNKTVSKQYYSRKAATIREEELRKLEKELAEMTAERTNYEEDYKKDLTKMRELKIKHADANEIAKLEKDMKKNRKLSSALGLNIKKQENEIEYVKSETYLNSLIKKLSNEKPENLPNEENVEDANEQNNSKNK